MMMFEAKQKKKHGCKGVDEVQHWKTRQVPEKMREKKTVVESAIKRQEKSLRLSLSLSSSSSRCASSPPASTHLQLFFAYAAVK
jgi:hypothetical protein